MIEEERERRYHDLISRYLWFYEALRTKARRPKTAAQRRFQDVAWGLADPETDHEQKYHFTTGSYLGFSASSRHSATDPILVMRIKCHRRLLRGPASILGISLLGVLLNHCDASSSSALPSTVSAAVSDSGSVKYEITFTRSL